MSNAELNKPEIVTLSFSKINYLYHIISLNPSPGLKLHA